MRLFLGTGMAASALAGLLVASNAPLAIGLPIVVVLPYVYLGVLERLVRAARARRRENAHLKELAQGHSPGLPRRDASGEV